MLKWTSLTIDILLNRFDERKLLIFFTIIASAIGRILFLPIPSQPSPPLCTNATEAGYDFDHSAFTARSHFRHNLDYRFNFDLDSQYNGSSAKNVVCEGIGMNSNSTNSCCPLEWCEDTPAITVPQFICGWLIGTLGYAYGTAFTISLISKLLNPQHQVCYFLYLDFILYPSNSSLNISNTHQFISLY